MLASMSPDLNGMISQQADENWGFFIKGNAVHGNQKDIPESTGYDFTNTGVTLGTDHRFSGNLVAGLMMGINSSRAHVDNWGSTVKSDLYSFGAYGSCYGKNFYLDASLSYGTSRYDNTRRILFQGVDRTANSSPSGNQWTAYGALGYDLQKNNWILTPNMSLQYAGINTEGYTESGADALNLNVDRLSIESLQGNIGMKLSYAANTDSALYLPHICASYGYEFLKDRKNITSRLAMGSSPFTTQTTSPDRNFISLGTGITAFTAKNTSLYINYDAQINLNHYIAHNVNAGLRFTF